MAKIIIALSSVTLHVEDPDNSVPFEFAIDGAVIQGRTAARPIPPWTPVAIEAEEAEYILSRHNGVRIPDGVVDHRKWLSDHADELGIPTAQRGALSNG